MAASSSYENVFNMPFARVYPLLVAKAQKRGRTDGEVAQAAPWLTGYTPEQILEALQTDITYGDFFRGAPQLNPRRDLVSGKICGVAIDEIDDPLMRDIRRLDKMVDELARGRALEKVLRS